MALRKNHYISIKKKYYRLNTAQTLKLIKGIARKGKPYLKTIGLDALGYVPVKKRPSMNAAAYIWNVETMSKADAKYIIDFAFKN